MLNETVGKAATEMWGSRESTPSVRNPFLLGSLIFYLKNKTHFFKKIRHFLFLLLIFLLPTQLARHFWPEWSYVWGLRVDYLAPTIYLTDLLVFLILGLWGLEKFKVKSSKFLFFYLVIFLFLMINCFFAKNPPAALYKFFKILEFSLLGFYVSKNGYSLFSIFYSLTFAIFYSSLIALAQFIKQSSLGGFFWWLGERTFNVATPGIAKIEIFNRLFLRPYATFSHPNALGGFLLVGLILTLPSLFKKQKILTGGFFLLVLGAIFLTFSRSTWLAGGFILFLLIFKKIKKISIKILFFIFFAFIFVYLIKLINFSSESFTHRWELTKIAVQLIKQSLFLGIGLNNFVVCLPEFWRQSILWLQPVHNIYLLVAAETGIAGFLIFLFLIIKTFKNLFKIENLELKIAFLTILLTGLFDHYWFTLQQNQLLLTIILGLIWVEKRNKIKTTNENY